MTREVTEQDFRKPEYINAKVEDYEFREDGALVRKDRWEMGIISIKHLVLPNKKDWEIKEVIQQVHELAHCGPDWTYIDDDMPISEQDLPNVGDIVDVVVPSGSFLVGCEYKSVNTFDWAGLYVGPVKWRKHKE